AHLLRIIAASGTSVQALLADVPRLVSTPELRIDCPDDRKEGIVREALAHFADRYPVSDVDGVRILFGPGAWGLIRSSNTQPILVMRFEARTAEELTSIRTEVESWLTARGIDVTPGVGH
ncbi:MAG: hypothetical protein RL139_809, partial [Gemmatimonadota bacterium]